MKNPQAWFELLDHYLKTFSPAASLELAQTRYRMEYPEEGQPETCPCCRQEIVWSVVDNVISQKG